MAEETNATAATGGEGTAATTTTTEAKGTEGSGATRNERGQFTGKDKAAEGTVDTSWRDGIEDDYRKVAERFSSPHEAVRSYAALEKRASNALFKPGKDASDEDKAKFQAALRAELGVPAELKDYKVDLPKTFDENDGKRVAELVALAHGKNVPPAFMTELLSWYEQNRQADTQRMLADLNERRGESQVKLKREWGPNYDAEVAVAVKAQEDVAGDTGAGNLLRMTGKELAAALGDTALGDHPDMIKAWNRVGRMSGESRVVTTTQYGKDIRTRIDEMRQDPRFKRGDRAYVAQVDDLYRKLYGDGAAAA